MGEACLSTEGRLSARDGVVTPEMREMVLVEFLDS